MSSWITNVISKLLMQAMEVSPHCLEAKKSTAQRCCS
jgi:hypothetical protein